MATYRTTVELAWAGAGSPGVNVWHFRSDAQLPGDEDVQSFVDQLQTFYTTINGLYSNDVQILHADEVIEDPYGSPTYRPVDGWSSSGQGGGAKAPHATALVAGWRTTAATRSGRGRTFISPLTLGTIEGDGTPSPAALSNLRTASAALVDWSVDAAAGAFGIYSQTDNVIRDIVSSQVRDTFAVLRSRRD